MKKTLRKCLGRLAISLGTTLPQLRGLLAPVGIRCAQDFFGERTVEVPRATGPALKLTNLDDCYLAFQLYWRGIDFYEPITRALLHELLSPGSTFLDLGAHVGLFSLEAALLQRDIRIFAFEPNPKNFDRLTANAKANEVRNMICEPIAVSDRDGTAMLYLAESDMSASLMKGFQSEDTVQVGQIQVRTTTLDKYVQQKSLKAPMVIKVDIEGHEPAFFRGATRTLAEHKPDILLEVLYEQDRDTVASLKSLGYGFYPITDEGLVETDAPKLVKRFPFLFFNHLLSTRPKTELGAIFERVRTKTGHIDLRKTSKHFPAAQWPQLWAEEKQTSG
ncbi:MAG TPA: FkbM family methyltransferase [Verrucomicrobiae bacterium]|jgi:FkbM family methyltransferase|nr:FkbM family methyltransferase [Verrucomicrobiae bacterium]